MVPDADYRIKLQVFEGPLDLLLFLIRKNELDIYDIPIESVTRQYIDALHAMQRLDLDVAGEFFVMAATLMEIKSRLLLPKGQHAVDPHAEDEEVDPRWELVHQLIQYRKFKDAAGDLAGLIETRQGNLPRLVPAASGLETERRLRQVDRIELWNTFNTVLRRLAEKLVVGEIHDEVVTVADQMEWLLGRLPAQGAITFTQLFPEGTTLRRLVATFLAMLELTRIRKVRVRQDEAFADILLEPVTEPPPAPLPPEPEVAAPAAAGPAPESVAAPAPAPEMPLETAVNPPTVTA
ncbi:MAG: segregation and condensation protein A [Opitutaceae bacterium]